MNAIAFPHRRAKSVGRNHPRAPRFTPPRLRDARWIIGVLLLLAGMGGTIGVIHQFDHSTTVWVARHAIVPGEKVNATDLTATRIRMARASDHYFTGAAPQAIAVRPITAGELVSRDSLGTAKNADVSTVAVVVDRGQAEVVHSGSDVQVWVATKEAEGGVTSYTTPKKLISSAFVNRIISTQSGVVSTIDGQSVELVVPNEQLASVIDSSNRGDRITLVPLAGGAGS